LEQKVPRPVRRPFAAAAESTGAIYRRLFGQVVTCGMHAREWASLMLCPHLVHALTTSAEGLGYLQRLQVRITPAMLQRSTARVLQRSTARVLQRSTARVLLLVATPVAVLPTRVGRWARRRLHVSVASVESPARFRTPGPYTLPMP
jgi:hypothetical protein